MGRFACLNVTPRVGSVATSSTKGTNITVAWYKLRPSVCSRHITQGSAPTPTLVTVASLDASTTNGRVLGSYPGTTLTLVTSNAEITGTYNAFTSLVLKTTNGGVQTDANVGHTLVITTSNAPIHGPVSFIGKAGAFDATLRTANSPLGVSVPKLQVGAALSSDARTSDDVASLVLPVSFEGRILQSTSSPGRTRRLRRGCKSHGKGTRARHVERVERKEGA